MNRIPIILLFVILWLVVYAQTQFAPIHQALGTPVSLVPALLTYCALTHELWLTATFAVVAALWFDSLSASRLGVSLVPMFLFAFVIQTRGRFILREQRYAQFWLALAGGILIPLATAAQLQLGRLEPSFTAATWWQLAVQGLLSGIACPWIFSAFDYLNQTFNYQAEVQNSFRSDRQIVRNRR